VEKAVVPVESISIIPSSVPTVTVLRRQRVLQRQYASVQPVVKRQVVGAIAEKRHIHVRMGVDKTGHQEPARPRNRFVRLKAGRRVVNGRNNAVFDIDAGNLHAVG
jgi:hypothetical protein